MTNELVTNDSKSKHDTATSSRASGARRQSVCTFWLAGQRYGLEVGLIGEIVTVDNVLPVPQAPSAVRGLFNLRGTPTVVLDLGEVLDIATKEREATNGTALVVRTDGVVIALLIDKMEAVVPQNRGTTTPPASGDHPAVGYFLVLDRDAGTVTVLDPGYLLERVATLRFLQEGD